MSKDTGKREKTLEVRVTAVELCRYRAAAVGMGMSVSVWVRWVLVKALGVGRR